MKKILVTGSLGYIGSVLVGYLKERGYSVVGFDTGFFEDALLFPANDVETHCKDVRLIEEIDLIGVDCVIHLAGISNDPVGALNGENIYDPTRSYSLKLANLCKKNNIKFIFASSCSVYGVGSDGYLDESSPTNPQTLYSLNKIQIEQDLVSISDRTFSPIALRFATVYGPSPRIRFDVVVNMLCGMASTNGSIVLNSNGLSWRPNLHILDACKAVHLAVQMDYSGGELMVLNVGANEDNLQILEIAKIIQSMSSESEIRFLSDNPELDKHELIKDRKISDGVDSRTYKISFEKIKKEIPGFVCDWNLSSGITAMLSKFQELGLTEERFKYRGYYRLQRLEDLFSQEYLTKDLRWQNGGGADGQYANKLFNK